MGKYKFSDDFLEEVFNRHKNTPDIPDNRQISRWVNQLLELLFPERKKLVVKNVSDIDSELNNSARELLQIMQATEACRGCKPEHLVSQFYTEIPQLYQAMRTDIEAIYTGDPAAGSEWEVIRSYPGFFAIAIYRIAHKLLLMEVPLLPRILTEYAHNKTGIDIHPGAVIGMYFFIDHGTGVVIGETSVIGQNVKIYQGVTLGAISINKEMKGLKRHPTIEDNVVIYAGATILGGDTIVGHDSIIGGNVWLTKSVAPHSRVYHTPEIKLIEKKSK